MALNEEQISEKVRRLIGDHLNFDFDEVKPDSAIREDLNADSLDCVELIMRMEEEFQIEISDADGEQCVTVADVCRLVARK